METVRAVPSIVEDGLTFTIVGKFGLATTVNELANEMVLSIGSCTLV